MHVQTIATVIRVKTDLPKEQVDSINGFIAVMMVSLFVLGMLSNVLSAIRDNNK